MKKPFEVEDPGVKVGDRKPVTVFGEQYICTVTKVMTCQFGVNLPEGWLDVTKQGRDEHLGIRVGIQGSLSPVPKGV